MNRGWSSSRCRCGRHAGHAADRAQGPRHGWTRARDGGQHGTGQERGTKFSLRDAAYRLLARAMQKARQAAEATATSTADRRCLHSHARQQPRLARTEPRQSPSRTPCRDSRAVATALSVAHYLRRPPHVRLPRHDAHTACAGSTTRIGKAVEKKSKMLVCCSVYQGAKSVGRWLHRFGRLARRWP